MSLGDRISELRSLNGISQTQLAKLMDVSRQAVSKWENGLSIPEPLKMIHLAEVLETDVEYLTTGRRSYERRPPVVIKSVEAVEKIVEKPVVQVVEKVVDTIIEKPVVEFVEKPVVKKVYRTKIVRNPIEFLICGLLSFLLGLVIGLFI